MVSAVNGSPMRGFWAVADQHPLHLNEHPDRKMETRMPGPLAMSNLLYPMYLVMLGGFTSLCTNRIVAFRVRDGSVMVIDNTDQGSPGEMAKHAA